MSQIYGEVATMMSDLQTYSGSSNNTTTLEQLDFGWRVWDIKNGQVRLISDDHSGPSVEVYLKRF